jgi:hypothetical protein
MWAGDVDTLDEIAGCRCCCHEHTFGRGCPAYAWGGCRGQCTMTHEDVESWASHYERFHGMTRENFYFGTNDASGPEA